MHYITVSSGACSSVQQHKDTHTANQTGSKPKGLGLAFDPLQRPGSKRSTQSKQPASATAAAAATGPSASTSRQAEASSSQQQGPSHGAVPPDIADREFQSLSAGFQKLMEELGAGIL